MANAVYPIYKTALLAASANVSLDNDTTADGPYCALVDTGVYTYSAAHDFYSDLSGIVGTDQRITSPTVGTVSEGTFDGADLTFSSVTGNSVEALVIYRHNSGANTTWRLVLYLDTGVTGLPVTPNGGDITVTWNASGIFTISDRRLKEDISLIGHVGDLGVYSYRYEGEDDMTGGFMADEVSEVAPDAVVTLPSGLMAVDYDAAVASQALAA